ncbi:MAG TPA: toxin-antitoxin system HicB family antitoxin [Thermomicrobiales bacterium]|nr:toxin-antitoxin system HicB family antitoxin [Thermomicrobiales bacterium]
MEPTTNNINENEPIIDETEVIEEIDVESTGVDEGPRGRGWRGKRGRRPFGPNRPYRFALFVEEDGSYVLRSPDLSEHSTKIESLDALGATMQAAIEERTAEDAVAAAEAEKDADYSGKFVLRLPRSMHRQLAELAEAEGVSLNQLALGFIAEGMGRSEMAETFGGRGRRGRRGGHGPGSHGPGGRGRGRGGPEGRGPEGRGPEGRGPGGPRGFGRGGRGREDRPEGQGRGERDHGFRGRGFRRPHFTGPFSGEQPATPEHDNANEPSFV